MVMMMMTDDDHEELVEKHIFIAMQKHLAGEIKCDSCNSIICTTVHVWMTGFRAGMIQGVEEASAEAREEFLREAKP